MTTQDIPRALKELADRYPWYEFLAKRKPDEPQAECKHEFEEHIWYWYMYRYCEKCGSRKDIDESQDNIQPKISKLEIDDVGEEMSLWEWKLFDKINEIITFINNL